MQALAGELRKTQLGSRLPPNNFRVREMEPSDQGRCLRISPMNTRGNRMNTGIDVVRRSMGAEIVHERREPQGLYVGWA